MEQTNSNYPVQSPDASGSHKPFFKDNATPRTETFVNSCSVVCHKDLYRPKYHCLQLPTGLRDAEVNECSIALT